MRQSAAKSFLYYKLSRILGERDVLNGHRKHADAMSVEVSRVGETRNEVTWM